MAAIISSIFVIPPVIGAAAFPKFCTTAGYTAKTIGTGLGIPLAIQGLSTFLFLQVHDKDDPQSQKIVTLATFILLSTTAVIAAAAKTGLISAAFFTAPVVLLTAATLFGYNILAIKLFAD